MMANIYNMSHWYESATKSVKDELKSIEITFTSDHQEIFIELFFFCSFFLLAEILRTTLRKTDLVARQVVTEMRYLRIITTINYRKARISLFSREFVLRYDDEPHDGAHHCILVHILRMKKCLRSKSLMIY